MRVPTIPGRQEESPLDLALAETSLSLRTINTLEKAGIFTVKDLLHVQEQKLLNIKNLGQKGLTEIWRAMKDLGIEKDERNQLAA